VGKMFLGFGAFVRAGISRLYLESMNHLIASFLPLGTNIERVALRGCEVQFCIWVF